MRGGVGWACGNGIGNSDILVRESLCLHRINEQRKVRITVVVAGGGICFKLTQRNQVLVHLK